MNIRLLRNTATPVLVSAMALLVGACGEPLEPEVHPEAGGVVIVDEGTGEVLSQSIGAGVAFDRPIQVAVGETLEVEVFFLDESDTSNRFLPDVDEGESLEVTIADEDIAAFDFHGDHGDFDGLTAGTTTAIFQLFHGGHSDFASGALTINVGQDPQG